MDEGQTSCLLFLNFFLSVLNQLVLKLHQHKDWNYNLVWSILFFCKGVLVFPKQRDFWEDGGATHVLVSMTFFINLQPGIYSGCVYQISTGWEISAYVVAIQA